jgi:nicotinamidase-related amidase
MPRTVKLDPARTLLLLVDVQERLAPAMPADDLARLLKYGRALLGAARELSLPVLVSEQYPKGLGRTVPELRDLLPSPALEKLHFSCAADPAFLAAIEETGRRQVLLAGMETHVCVFQTARDLAALGYEVHACADAVASRSAEHRRVGLELIREAGGIVTTAETALFDLLHVAGTPAFRALAPLVR